jgi:putative methyltransferase (TIGR04325 family)
MQIHLGHNQTRDWETAELICRQIGGDWDSSENIESKLLEAKDLVSGRSPPFKKQLTTFELSLITMLTYCFSKMSCQRSFSILDFGGGGGLYVGGILRSFFPSFTVDLTIIETECLTRELSKYDQHNIRWRPSIPNKKFDIAIASGSLQYVRNYESILVSMLSQSIYVVVDRLPLLSEITEDAIFVQVARHPDSGRLRSFPTYAFHKHNFITLVEKHRNILHTWVDTTDSITFKGHIYHYHGLLAGYQKLSSE